jgi:SAM-dependent methyltransferase
MDHTKFEDAQYDSAYPRGIAHSWWNLARNNVIERTFRLCVPKNALVLDVGCGKGIVTSHLRSAGWDVMGVDIGTPTEGLLASEHLMLGINALELDADLRSRVTVLALFDVIEHVSDASAFLRALLAAFPQAGQVVLTVPARQELWSNFDDHYGHLRRYDRPTLQKEMSCAGLATESAGYFFHSLYPAIALNNLVRGGKRKIRLDPPAPGRSSRVLNAMIASAFSIEAILLPGSWIGSSIIGTGIRQPSNTTRFDERPHPEEIAP